MASDDEIQRLSELVNSDVKKGQKQEEQVPQVWRWQRSAGEQLADYFKPIKQAVFKYLRRAEVLLAVIVVGSLSFIAATKWQVHERQRAPLVVLHQDIVKINDILQQFIRAGGPLSTAKGTGGFELYPRWARMRGDVEFRFECARIGEEFDVMVTRAGDNFIQDFTAATAVSVGGRELRLKVAEPTKYVYQYKILKLTETAGQLVSFKVWRQ